MDKKLIIALTLSLPMGAFAQSAVDAFSASQYDLRGTARFMSMGGAFTALGGDISTLTQNPGGIGLYRSNDLSLTLDLEAQSTSSKVGNMTDKTSETKFKVNNFGYIGSVRTNNEVMPFFNWGVSYTRSASFDRHYGGRLGALGTSLTNLVADYTTADGYTGMELAENNQYNPYTESWAPWTSILMYNAYAINPTAIGANSYAGLFDYNSSSGEGWYDIEEKGYVDEYAINFGGNVMNMLYWGVGFGITDIDFKQYAYYREDINDANVPDKHADSYTSGDASLSYRNAKHIYGNGFNFKAGVIVKPINELRIGLAVHTPTYYNLTYEGHAIADYNYLSDNYDDGTYYNGSYDTEYDDVDWKLQSPWRLMAGIAGVIDGRAIISADYEYRAYGNMKVKDWDGNEYTDINDDIKTYYQPVNILRVGAEYRVTPSFSLRAGYIYESSPVKSEILDPSGSDATYIYTSGPDDTETQPAFSLDRETNYITCGLGYRYKNVYADLAYVYRNRKSDYHAFTDYNENVAPYYLVQAPKATVTDKNSSVVLTLGVRF